MPVSVAEVLRQIEGSSVVCGGWVFGDVWFGSVTAAVEAKIRLGVYTTFVVKQNLTGCAIRRGRLVIGL